MRHGPSSSRRARGTALLASAFILVACSTPPADESPPALPVPVPQVEDALRLTILHSFSGHEEREGLRGLIAAFGALHPEVTVHEELAPDRRSLGSARLADGSTPDVIIDRDPRLLVDLIGQGTARPLDGLIDAGRLASEVVPGLIASVTFDDRLFAVPVGLDIKSLVWYSPSLFEAQRYAIPTSWDDMVALSQRMVDDGIVPWCIGIESGPATGWVVTDWVEDVLLRALGVEAYDAWVAGGLPFASAEVRGALERYLVPIWTDDFVAGGRAAISAEPFATSALGVVGDDPRCGMHRQALFIGTFIADLAPEAMFGIDVDFFLLPGVTPSDRPVLGIADVAIRTSDAPAAGLFLQYLGSEGSADGWAGPGGLLSPFLSVLDGAARPTEMSRRAAEILGSATAFRLDGSDRMPPEVGASNEPRSFWTEMTAWVNDETSLQDALEAIDARYREVARGDR